MSASASPEAKGLFLPGTPFLPYQTRAGGWWLKHLIGLKRGGANVLHQLKPKLRGHPLEAGPRAPSVSRWLLERDHFMAGRRCSGPGLQASHLISLRKLLPENAWGRRPSEAESVERHQASHSLTAEPSGAEVQPRLSPALLPSPACRQPVCAASRTRQGYSLRLRAAQARDRPGTGQGQAACFRGLGLH